MFLLFLDFFLYSRDLVVSPVSGHFWKRLKGWKTRRLESWKVGRLGLERLEVWKVIRLEGSSGFVISPVSLLKKVGRLKD